MRSCISAGESSGGRGVHKCSHCDVCPDLPPDVAVRMLLRQPLLLLGRMGCVWVPRRECLCHDGHKVLPASDAKSFGRGNDLRCVLITFTFFRPAGSDVGRTAKIFVHVGEGIKLEECLGLKG